MKTQRILTATRAAATMALALLAIAALTGAATGQQAIPAHPADLSYPALDFDPPNPAELRHELPNGSIAFVVEDHELPLVNVALQIRTGAYTAPAAKMPGLASMTGSQLRNGGTAAMAPADFDEELDFLAASMSSGIGSTSGSAGINCLSKDLDRCLELFFEMLRQPRFDEQRLELARSQALQGMQRRNDDTGSIERREWARLLRGTEHFTTVPTTEASINAIGADDLRAFHEFALHPSNFVFAISGDVDTDAILQRIGAEMSSWEVGEAPGDVPAPATEPTPGLYLVDKEDVNQGRISIGHLGATQDNPDRYALMIMNDILGGGGFTSRIMSRVRSDEGLAYSAGSSFGFGTYYPADFRAFFQSRSNAVARATAIVLEEIERIRTEPVSEEELSNAKASFIETFSRNFASAGQVAGLFAGLELVGRDPAYLQTYRENIAAVTAADVTRVASEYLHPDQLVILAVGNVADMLAGDPENPDYSLEGLAPGGNVVRIALPDPMTMEYPEN
jgi:zinc protease